MIGRDPFAVGPTLLGCVVLASGCVGAKGYERALEPDVPRQAAYFDWFDYAGHDPVYEGLEPASDEYLNPILAGFYPDPSIVRVRDDYYLVTSSFGYFPGIPIFHSRDLVHWNQLGHVLARPSQLDLAGAEISEGIFAPVIRHHRGSYYVITTHVLRERLRSFIVTAENPAGPWSDPIWLPELDGIDPSLYFDDDGQAYVVFNSGPPEAPRYEGHRAIWIQRYDPKARVMQGPRQLLVNGGVDITKRPIWIEAPHILKVNGTYYLIAAEGGTEYGHSEVVFRSQNVLGPYQAFAGNPILTQRHLDVGRPHPITSTGHADFVQTPAGEWWAVFLGTRPYGDDLYNTGRETFLMPVRWEGGWPIIAAGTEPVPYLHRAPALPTQPPPAMRTSGNFSLRDDFDKNELAPYWNMIRTPRENWYDLSSKPGWLTLHARPVELGKRGQPSFIGRRQQHMYASVSTAMVYSPRRRGDKAGLVAFQNDDFYYFLGIELGDGGPVVAVERHAKLAGTPRASVIASAPLLAPPNNRLFLKIDARGGAYDFSYAHEPQKWKPLVLGADGTLLSTKIAKGFVGTFFGLHAYCTER